MSNPLEYHILFLIAAKLKINLNTILNVLIFELSAQFYAYVVICFCLLSFDVEDNERDDKNYQEM